MNSGIVDSSEGVTLLAGGPVLRRDLARAQALAPTVVAVDGGANRALAAGLDPLAVIGDLDSVSAAARARFAGVLYAVAEQDSTDFDKALRHIRAPFILGVGCLGGRVDHELAALSVLVKRPDTLCLLIGREDIVFAAPPDMEIALRAGDRFSLFAMARVTGRSEGLRWPVEGIEFAPDGRGGTSNMATGMVRLQMDAPGMLVIVPRARLKQALAGRLASSRAWGGAR